MEIYCPVTDWGFLALRHRITNLICYIGSALYYSLVRI